MGFIAILNVMSSIVWNKRGSWGVYERSVLGMGKTQCLGRGFSG